MQLKTYKNRPGKLEVQKTVLATIQSSVFIGLCGPDIIEYLQKIQYQRFKKVIFYETDKNLYKILLQKLGSNYPTVKLVNDDINKHLGRQRAFYDLDFCRSILDIEHCLPKICEIKEFAITCSLRPIGTKNTLKMLRNHLPHLGMKHYTYSDGNPMILMHISKRLWS